MMIFLQADTGYQDVLLKLVDWPFLFFVLLMVVFLNYRKQFGTWLQNIAEFELTKDGIKFKIGKDEVPLEKLDETITDRLRELEERIEILQANTSASDTESVLESVELGEIPAGLKRAISETVDPMLASKLWVGRYVETLARSAAVSEDTMMKYLEERSDLGLYKDGSRWVAAYKDRLT